MRNKQVAYHLNNNHLKVNYLYQLVIINNKLIGITIY
jgi:hypothetical protein